MARGSFYAKRIIGQAESDLLAERENLTAARKRAEDRLRDFEALRTAIQTGTLPRIAEFLAKEGHAARITEKDFGTPDLPKADDRTPTDASATALPDILVGLLKSVSTGYAARAGAMSLGTAVGTASTGTAISGLGGAAASNSLLAWFGGGALTVGGGGMAAGGIVLGGIFAIPAAVVLALKVAETNEVALTNAATFRAEADVIISASRTTALLVNAIEDRANELDSVIGRVHASTVAHLEILEGSGNSDRLNTIQLYRLVILAKALAGLLAAKVYEEKTLETSSQSLNALHESADALEVVSMGNKPESGTNVAGAPAVDVNAILVGILERLPAAARSIPTLNSRAASARVSAPRPVRSAQGRSPAMQLRKATTSAASDFGAGNLAAAACSVVTAIFEYCRVANVEHTKRQQIAAWREVNVAKLESDRKTIETCLAGIFAERQFLFGCLIEEMRVAGEAAEPDRVRIALEGILALADKNPLTDLTTFARELSNGPLDIEL